MITLCLDPNTYAVVLAGLKLSASIAERRCAPELAERFRLAQAEVEQSHAFFSERTLEITPALLRRQA